MLCNLGVLNLEYQSLAVCSSVKGSMDDRTSASQHLNRLVKVVSATIQAGSVFRSSIHCSVNACSAVSASVRQ